MPFPIQEFWSLAIESRLFSPPECQRLAGAFAQIKGAMESGNAFTLSEWLISQNVLTRYQAKVLLARRPGPFIYGDYKVQDRIDAGRLQGLFRAVHLPTRQHVCLCFLTGPHLQDPQALTRLKQVLSAAAGLKHPHVARLYHLADLPDFKFAVLADLQGRTLEEFLTARGAFPLSEACRLVRQAALGLAEIHKTGQTHGDLRPANLWQDATGNLKLLWLPLARDPLAPSTAVLISHGQLDPAQQAAADYLAPELLAATRWPDHPGSDLYALGCTLYHLLAGQPPFAGGDLGLKLRRHAQEQPPLVSQVNRQAPPALAQIVAYLIAKDPAARYQQAAQVAEALAPFVDPAARGPVVEPANSTSLAYEAWLEQQQPPALARSALPAAAAPQIPMALPVPPGVAPAAVPVAQPAMGGFAPLAAPVRVATPAAAMPAVAVAVAAPPTPPAPGLPAAPSGPSIAVSSAARSKLAVERKHKQRTESRNKVYIGAGVGLVTLIVGFLVYSGSRKPVEVTPAAAPVENNALAANTPATKPPAPAELAPVVETGPPAEPLASIDNGPLWDSPTAGAPLNLRYLPATQMYLALRPAEIVSHPEGRQVLASLGIEEFFSERLLHLAGTTPDNLEQVIVAFAGRGMGQPLAISLVARAKQGVELETLKQNWNASEAIDIDGQNFHQGASHSFYVPPEGANKLLIAIPTSDAKELTAWLATAKNPPLLRPKLEMLSRTSDDLRLATVLAAPDFLTGEGQAALAGTLADLSKPVQGFLADETGQLPAAAMFSLHLSDALFLELRVAAAGANSTDLAKLYQSRSRDLESAVESYCGALSMSPYSQPILLRYPKFFSFVAENTRAGTNTSDKQVVLRTALPAIAASNLAFGTHLALLEAGGGGGSVAATASMPAGPKTLADRLKQKYTLTFDRDSLERTLTLMSTETGVPITILGGDLQLEGITKNQSFGLDEKDKPIFEILKVIMQKANPAGNLIYVFQKIDGQETVVVTTRAAAAKRGDAIPPELK